MDTTELAALRDRCPRLTALRLDIRVEATTCDNKILWTLASFPRLQELALYVHQLPPGNVAAPKLVTQRQTEQLFEEAANHILALRSRISGCQRLNVAFSQVRNYDENDETSVGSSPDITFFMNDDGDVRSKITIRSRYRLRAKYAVYPTEQLQQKLHEYDNIIASLSGIRALGPSEVKEEINEELERRRRLERADSHDLLTEYHRSVVTGSY
jgi:hypothetical protein